MFLRLDSLRLRLLGAMVATALVGLVGAYFAIAHILAGSDLASDRRQAVRTADKIAARLGTAGDPLFLRTAQEVLPAIQLVVYERGRVVFRGPALGGELEATIERPFPGGRVVVRKYALSTSNGSFDVTLVAAAVSGLMILTVLLAADSLTRTIRRPLTRAIAAADRVAAGDLTARMGGGGPDEFDRLSRAFDGMAERLEAADTDQRRFLADIAHEIATPVGALSNLAGALADGTATTAEERKTTVELLTQETTRVQALLDDLRRLTRLDLAEPLRREPVDLGGLCRDLGRRFERAAVAAGLSLDVDAEPLRTISDRRLLETILGNFVTNAIRYTPPGGAITVRARARRGRPAIAVADTGIGIPEEHRARVFDRLYRIDSDRGRGSGGSGLGLAIASRAALALGATIELESAPGAGSTFTLVLPR